MKIITAESARQMTKDSEKKLRSVINAHLKNTVNSCIEVIMEEIYKKCSEPSGYYVTLQLGSIINKFRVKELDDYSDTFALAVDKEIIEYLKGLGFKVNKHAVGSITRVISWSE